MKKVITACVDGAKIFDLCVLGDKEIEDGVKPFYVKNKVPKGLYMSVHPLFFPLHPTNLICAFLIRGCLPNMHISKPRNMPFFPNIV